MAAYDAPQNPGLGRGDGRAKEAAEVIREVGEKQALDTPEVLQLHRLSALLVGVLAMLLAFATISTGAATRKQLNTNIKLTDLRSDTDAPEKSAAIRPCSAANFLQAMLDAANPDASARANTQKLIDSYASNAQSIDKGTTPDDSLKAREDQIDALQESELHVESQILSFEYSEVALQIAGDRPRLARDSHHEPRSVLHLVRIGCDRRPAARKRLRRLGRPAVAALA